MATERFTKDHEWIRVDGDIGTVGITDYAQTQLGDVVFVELPEVGAQGRRKGEAVAVVESVKAASDVYRAGRPARWSRSTATSPASRRSSTRTPRARPGSSSSSSPTPAELDALMDRAAYEAFVEGTATDALSAAHRRRPPRHAGAGSASPPSTPCSPTCPTDKRLDEPGRPARGQGRAGGRARARHAGGAERRPPARCRSSSAPAPTSTTCRRPSIT